MIFRWQQTILWMCFVFKRRCVGCMGSSDSFIEIMRVHLRAVLGRGSREILDDTTGIQWRADVLMKTGTGPHMGLFMTGIWASCILLHHWAYEAGKTKTASLILLSLPGADVTQSELFFASSSGSILCEPSERLHCACFNNKKGKIFLVQLLLGKRLCWH